MSLRDLPSVDRLAARLDGLPRAVAVDVARSAVAEARLRIEQGDTADATETALRTARHLRAARPRSVINATGVLLHTNLGRAPLHSEAATAAKETATGYQNLELDLETGERGGRAAYLHGVLTSITGAEAALAVNNNAGALLLTLACLASRRPVPVSRGELIEIGGSYRLPELMAASGAVMVEVGTTNRTRVADYRAAVDADPAILLKVHPSNYRVAGFVESTSLRDLASLAGEVGTPLVFDAGSGLVDERTPWLPGPTPGWLSDEPGVVQSLEAGADLVLFSGDKLFAGPQAGIVVGRADLVDRLRAHPFARALRLDGPTLAALTVTAELHADGRAGELPFWMMATRAESELETRGRTILESSGVEGRLESVSSTPGGGSVPGSELPSVAIVIDRQVDARYLALLAGEPYPVVARRDAGRLLVDLRSVPERLDPALGDALASACST